MSLMSLGIIRGFVGQIIGTIFGIALTMLARVALGMSAYATEPVWVIAIVTGALGFLYGVGSMSDWFQWFVGNDIPLRHGPPKGQPAWTRYFSVDYNHKVIGIQYAVTSLVMLFIGGGFAVIFRTELTRSGLQFLEANQYNSYMGMHGWAAIFSILIGIGALGNYLVPLMIGAEDMAFPRLNAFAFWLNVPASIYLFGALLFGGWDAGWTAYPPLSTMGSPGYQFLFLGVFVLGFSSILGSLNIMATIMLMRPKG